jgi:hypothetical protein
MKDGLVVPSSYRQFTHDYMVTSHKSQGKTANHVVVAAAKLDERAAYVATSRGRQSCDIHTPDTEHLIAGARRDSLRVGVVDSTKLSPSYGNQIDRGKIPESPSDVQAERQTKGKIVLSGDFFTQHLPSPAKKLNIFSMSPKLKSMHSMRRQSVRVRSFATRMIKMIPKSMKLVLSSAMRIKVMKENSMKYNQTTVIRL